MNCGVGIMHVAVGFWFGVVTGLLVVGLVALLFPGCLWWLLRSGGFGVWV